MGKIKEIWCMPHSHLDIGYTHPHTKLLFRQPKFWLYSHRKKAECCNQSKTFHNIQAQMLSCLSDFDSQLLL